MRTTTFLAVLLWAVGASALAQTPSARLRAETEERARREVGDLFGTLCPEQCVLLSVQAGVDDEPISTGVPGFEALSGAASVPVLKTLAVQVVFDQALPSAFRTKLKGLTSQKLAAHGVEPSVVVQAVTFPPRNAPHLEAPERQPPAPALPAPAEPAGEEAAPVVPQPLGARITEALIPAAPLLAVIVLLILGTVMVGTLLYLAVRRAHPTAQEGGYWEEGPLAETGAAQSSEAGSFPEERLRRLERALIEDRPLRNLVVRQALSHGEAAKVAVWTREFGQSLLDDVRADAIGLDGLGEALATSQALDGKARTQALFELEGRVLAASLHQRGDPAEQAFAFLEGVPPERFAAACRAMPVAAAEVVLRYARADQRAAAIRELPPGQQAELALAWGRKPEVSTRYAITVAEELRHRISETAGGAAQSERLLREIVGALPREQQDRVAERLASESGGQRVLLTESSLATAPAEILSAALLQLPSARIVTYLSGTEDELRERLLKACPARIQNELREELGAAPAAGREDYIAARRQVLDEVQRELGRRGLGLDELTRWKGTGPSAAREGGVV